MLKVKETAVAGTLESSDVMVTVEPGDGIQLSVNSSVINQYGRAIRTSVMEVLERLEVKDAKVTVVDRGALDCTLRARVECAVFRADGTSEKNIPWGGGIQ